MILPRIVRSGSTSSRCWAPPRATRKPLITSSNTSSAPVSSASRRSFARKPSDGAHQSHVGRVGLADDRRELAERQRLRVVPRDDHRVGRLRMGHARRRRYALGRKPRPGLGQQPVHVPVVGAGELEDPVAAGGGARKPQGAHRGLGPRRGHSNHLGARHALDDLRGQGRLGLRRSTEARAGGGSRAHGRDDLGVSVPRHERPPREHPVDVAVAVHVDQLRALAACDEYRIAADGAHRADRRVHPTREQLHRLGVGRGRTRLGPA